MNFSPVMNAQLYAFNLVFPCSCRLHSLPTMCLLVCMPLPPVLKTRVHVILGLLKITGLFGLLEFLGIGAV